MRGCFWCRPGLVLALLTCFWAAGALARADPTDWPCWRGPRRDGISSETGLVAPWPKDGPPELWRIKLGAGFSSVVVVDGRAYTMYADEKDEYVVSIGVADGSVLWKTRSGVLFENEYGNGPRATPTVYEGCVYAHGPTGELLCLDAESGKKIWGYNLLAKLPAENLEFGLAVSPVILEEMLLVGGGKNGKALAALNRKTGEILWTSLKDKAGYSTPIAVDVDGMRQILVLTGQAIVGVAPEDGRPLWRHPWKTTLDANVATPIYHAGRLFVSTGYGTGCGMFALKAADGKPSAQLLWANKNMKNYFSTSVLIDGHLYGFNNTMLTCMSFQTGEVLWRQRGFNKGSLIAADGKLIVYGERGTLALAEVSPQEYREISRTEVLPGRTWTVPTLAEGKLFLRNEEELVCLKLKP